MEISKITKISGFVCVIISIFTLCLVFLMNLSIEKERYFVHRQLEFRQLGHDLGQASDFLTRQARRYTIFGDQRHFDAYWKEVNEIRTRDKVVERLKALDAAPMELALIKTAKANSDALIATEDKAMKAVMQGKLKYAQTLMFDENYDRDKKIIMTPIREFQRVMNIRAEKEAHEARQWANILVSATNAIVVLYIILVLFVLYFIFFRKISHPLHHMTQAINRIASGETDKTIPYIDDENEIGQLAKAAELFKISLMENQVLSIDLQRHKNNLEQEIAAQTKDLTEANNELEEFAYRTSHDLRSPIISSAKLLEMTEKSIHNNERDKALLSLSHARNALQKLETLIEDILNLTEAKTKEEEAQDIDIHVLVKDALEKMEHMEAYEHLDVQIDLQFKNTLWAKKSRVNMILENLISNAIKYQDREKRKSLYSNINAKQK